MGLFSLIIYNKINNVMITCGNPDNIPSIVLNDPFTYIIISMHVLNIIKNYCECEFKL